MTAINLPFSVLRNGVTLSLSEVAYAIKNRALLPLCILYR